MPKKNTKGKKIVDPVLEDLLPKIDRILKQHDQKREKLLRQLLKAVHNEHPTLDRKILNAAVRLSQLGTVSESEQTTHGMKFTLSSEHDFDGLNLIDLMSQMSLNTENLQTANSDPNVRKYALTKRALYPVLQNTTAPTTSTN